MLAVALAAGCARPTLGTSRKTVITSVTPLGSIMRNVLGEGFDVVSLVTPRRVASGRLAPPASFEVEALESNTAGAIFLGTFDSGIAEAISDVAGGEVPTWLISEITPAVMVGEFPWVDPIAAQAVATEVRNIALKLPASDREHLDRNLEEFTSALGRIHEVLSDTASAVPVGRRKVAATSESMRPFFERYGFGYFSPESEGGASGLAVTMKREGITALYVNGFGSDQSRDMAQEVLRAGEGSFQGVLFDALLPGPAGSLYHTYFGLVIENARQAFGPLGADLEKLDGLRPVDVAP